ncbi:MAG: ATP-dependent DNA ligase [Pseudomonadota bacterium]|nr:ATP-dependent DNA ligase [Pseudomonadota bacterium]
MEAKLVDTLPVGSSWRYEPKWDGFRCLAFRDGPDVDLRSKSGQPFNRYFPELVHALEALDATSFVLDGELVVPVGDGLSFDELLMRIHPAQSRVQKLAREHPVLFVVFDLLVDEDGVSLVADLLADRRRKLEAFVTRHATRESLLRLSPQALDVTEVETWFRSLGAGLDGVIAKRADLPYRSGERTGMQKFKRMRTADCVVGGFRYGSKGGEIGSLLLGLFDDSGLLHHVGFSSSIKASERAALTRKVEKLKGPPGFTGRAPGGPSRWSTERSGEWEPLEHELVAEVQYDHFSGDRFRHGTRFLRWRPDKAPAQCTLAQVAQEASSTLALLEPARTKVKRGR